tara:strand:- start:1805 stop:2320 length:516 start_codon:yes stop_codon:yes gene_type:complete
MIEAGKSYKMMDANGKEQHFAIVNRDANSGTYDIIDLANAGRRHTHKSLRNFTVVKPVRKCSVRTKCANPTVHSKHTQLYIVQTDSGTYKIGCTDDLDARMRAGRTWCANMRTVATRTIPRHKSANWRRYEGKVHKRVSKQRCSNGGNEVFKLKRGDLRMAVKYMHNMRFD